MEQSKNRQFVCRPLDGPGREILTFILELSLDSDSGIHCILKHEFDENLAFSALPYAWGDPQVTAQVFLDREWFQLSTNLAPGVWHIRCQDVPVVM